MPSLDQVIEDLLADADHKAMQAKTGEKPIAAKVRLKHGLAINIREDVTQYVLIIWRMNDYPAFREWNTVCSFWPYPIGVPNAHKGRYTRKDITCKAGSQPTQNSQW